MLKPIAEFGKQAGITGFRDVEIKDIDTFLRVINEGKPPDTEIQVFNAGRIATWAHLYFAVLNALTAFKNRRNMSRTLAMETMLYASAQGQIRKATEILGVKPGQASIAVLVIGEEPETVDAALSSISKQIKGREDEMVLDITKEKAADIKKTFDISEVQLKAVMKGHRRKEDLINLVIEKIALLATER